MSLATWLRRMFAFLLPPDETPEPGPVEIFEQAVSTARQRFLDLRATANPLYASRDALTAQVEARKQEATALTSKAAGLLKEGREKEALEVAARQGRVDADRERLEKELADLAAPIAQVEARLRKIEGEVRDLERERDRSAALLKSADARVAVDRILSAQVSAAQGSAGPADLSGAREQVSLKLEQARALEQITASGTQASLDALESDVEEESARARLEAIRATALLPPGQDDKKDKPL